MENQRRICRRNRAEFWVLISLVASVFFACSIEPAEPPEVREALKAAGENRPELEKAIKHFRDLGDSLKLEAAYFLIGNMQGHGYITYSLLDTAGSEVEFDALAYPDYVSLTAAWDTLQETCGELDFEKKEFVEDLDTITAAFLIDQIDFAFLAWRTRPWARGLSFEQFCEYVLPYRGSNEPLEPWREAFLKKYNGIEATMADSTDPVAVAGIINDDVKSWFSFDPRYYYHPVDQGLSEMISAGKGRCEDMTNLTIYAMRANGLAVTSDYTPYWADAGNNHAWNSLVLPSGKVIPFMGAEANPGQYSLANKVAKVYRKTYAVQPGNLIFQKRKQEKVPGWLGGKSYADVTSAYVQTCTVKVTFDSAAAEIPDSVDIAYLCVFNSGEWQPIHWGRIEGGAAVFTDMGREIAYLPALYINEKIAPIGDPFILTEDCELVKLKADSGATASIKPVATSRPPTESLRRVSLNTGKQYELFYWADGWQSAGKALAGSRPLVFEAIPAGGLYWLLEDGSDKEERIFTLREGKQVWW